MKGSYSFSDYEELLGDKKNEIVQFIDGFMPTIQEFRENYKKVKVPIRNVPNLLSSFWTNSSTEIRQIRRHAMIPVCI